MHLTCFNVFTVFTVICRDKLTVELQLWLPVFSFCIWGWRVQNCLVVLHVHHTFCIQLNLCRERGGFFFCFFFCGDKIRQKAEVWKVEKLSYFRSVESRLGHDFRVRTRESREESKSLRSSEKERGPCKRKSSFGALTPAVHGPNPHGNFYLSIRHFRSLFVLFGFVLLPPCLVCLSAELQMYSL